MRRSNHWYAAPPGMVYCNQGGYIILLRLIREKKDVVSTLSYE